MTEPEFSRVVPLDEIGEATEHRIEANEAERAALARRFDLRAVDALAARLTLLAVAGGVRVTGNVAATATQVCVISGEDVPARIDEAADLLLLHDITAADEVELHLSDCDVLPLEGRTIDLGEIAAQTLGVALDPYPHADAAKLAAARKLLLSEEDAARRAEEVKAKASPFAVLKRGNDEA